jgi:hypothetical protein
LVRGAQRPQLDEEFRYLQRKKNVVKELSEVRMKVRRSTCIINTGGLEATLPQNIHFISHLVKFRVVPTHLILHIFKVCLDDFSGTNIENIAMLLEGCGRFLLRSEDTRERFGKMVRLSYALLARMLNYLLGGAYEEEAKSSALRPASDPFAGECILSGTFIESLQ